MTKISSLLIAATLAIGVEAYAANATIEGVWKDDSGYGLDFVITKLNYGYSIVWKNEGATYKILAVGDSFFTFHLDQGLQQVIWSCGLGGDVDSLVCKTQILYEGQITGPLETWTATRGSS